MSKLFTRNGKLKKASAYTVNFGIPALKTCPMAKICKDYCYANKGAYIWPVVKAAYERRFEATKNHDFDVMVCEELFNMPKVEAVRIHDSGDFYNEKYLMKWINAAHAFPDRVFYAYTKRVVMLKNYQAMGMLPDNFKIIYSIGGSEDRHIDMMHDRHSRIFNTEQELIDAGYINATHDDTIAWASNNNKIGLVIH